ncbi:MAG: glycoside hydrolase family 13 protein, partial [Faecalibacterium sp.]
MSCFFDSFHEFFKTPFGALPAGDALTLRLKIPTNFGAVQPRLVIHKEGTDHLPMHYKMDYVKTENNLHLFIITLHPEEVGLYFYWFDLYSDYRCIWKDANGRGTLGWSKSNAWQPSGDMWQLTVYEKDFKTPDNYKGKVFYQIFPDRFCEGQKRPMPYPDRFYQPDKTAEPAWHPTEEGGKL